MEVESTVERLCKERKDDLIRCLANALAMCEAFGMYSHTFEEKVSGPVRKALDHVDSTFWGDFQGGLNR